jgi:hypothetical protein
VLAAAVRPPLALLTEALRAASSAEGLLGELGGLRARILPRAGAVTASELGFREAELALLQRVDGRSTLEQLLLGSGLRQEVALRTLALSRAFGLVEIEPSEEPVVERAPTGDLEIQRLEAKFSEVQDADYFTVLGLQRGAGSAEVRRAYELLSVQFHPLRYAGHPDTTLQQRARVVQDLLGEALGALEDDRLRGDYARNLRD